MFIHIGNNEVVRSESVIGYFDLDNTSQSKRTREFLAKAQNEGRVRSEVSDLPKSFVITCENGETTVHLSQLNTQTLVRRSK